ncbi:MAG TPA: hypothetical protein PKA02_04355 [Candidatus Saccharibacteria bacterium]|nr:hypothetical protein [Candidatus Saccharibacteria bacterium]
MAYESKKPKQKSHKLTREKLIKRDAMALAELIYDIYQEKKIKEKKDATS